MIKDHFENRASDWDQETRRTNGAKKIADAISKNMNLTSNMDILDFGVGTGLLGFEIAKNVRQVYGVDTSASMLEKLKAKNTPELNIQTFCQDIVKEPLNQKFDGLVSSMTLHHVKNLELFFKTIYKNLKDNGFIAIADLQSEDGSFHSDNAGVFHFGFNEKELSDIIEKAGFTQVKFEDINTISKPHKDFGVFLLTAKKKLKIYSSSLSRSFNFKTCLSVITVLNSPSKTFISKT
ncbi:class I SAM-dependent methyltransferase [Sulfurimonas sp.]|uniref:class I SAM-dependent DNA methyltransferase n=1 Tax=Sulfurimonas sp. TaxID=2022749 RepID=UPI002AAF96B6|nr:class I SAM-dependent methyltransferase [Sulfurimonas sp.]